MYLTLICVLFILLVTGAFPLHADDEHETKHKQCTPNDCDPEIDEDCPVQNCYYGDCDKKGKCDCDLDWTGSDCNKYVGKPKGNGMKNMSNIQHHSRVKRAAAVPTKIQFTLTKTPSPLTNLRVGQRLDFKLVVKFPNKMAQPLLIELFTPDNTSTIMMLCDVRISKVGTHIKNKDVVKNTEIVMDAKQNEPWPYDRAILNFVSKIDCCEPSPPDDAAISMDIEFSAVMYSSTAKVNTDYWISAGAEYEDGAEIWVGQAKIQYDATAYVSIIADDKLTEEEIECACDPRMRPPPRPKPPTVPPPPSSNIVEDGNKAEQLGGQFMLLITLEFVCLFILTYLS